MANEKYSTFSGAPQHQAGAQESPPHPHSSAPWYSKLLLSWVTPLMAVGNGKQLDDRDIWELKLEHQSAQVSLKYSQDYAQTHSLAKAFMKSFGWRFVIAGFVLLVAMLCNLFGPLVLNHVLSGMTSQEYDIQDLSRWILALFCTKLLQAFANNYGIFDMELMNLQFTAALKNILYKKTLRLSPTARKGTSTGAISNMYLTDCFYINMAGYYVHKMWLLPLQILIAGFLLFQVLGVASFAGLGVVALMLVGNSYFTKKAHGLHGGYMQLKDTRMKRITEVFKAISVVKFNAWEDKMVERIGKARADEVANIYQFLELNLWLNVITWGLPVFVCVAAFGVHVGLLNRELTPAIVFTSLALFQLIQAPLREIAQAINFLVGAKVATKRVGDFLDLSEIDSANVLTAEHPSAQKYIHDNVIISIESGGFGWDEESVQLQSVNLQIKTGDFVAVHGRVGSGKSSLCSALLGEMIKRNGSVYVGGCVAYCSQQPWIQNMTVRDNILFGLPYDHAKYEKVLEACALRKDLASMPAGDKTEIGERGINVSGGQKSRLALARACYSDADIFILDAPLAAVDVIVQNEIFQKCLLGLLRNKTIVLVTHNPEIIASPHVDSTVAIDDSCTVIQTRSSSHEHQDLLQATVSPLAARAYSSRSFEARKVQEYAVCGELAREYEQDHASDENEKLIKPEFRSEGRVSGYVFSTYYRAIGGFPVAVAVLTAQVAWQLLQISSDFWLGRWSSDALSGSQAENRTSAEYRMAVYTLLGAASTLMFFLRTYAVFGSGLTAAKSFFDRMTVSLIHAPMSFFDANPIGRILTRYSNDVGDSDFSVPLVLGNFFANLFSVTGSLLTAAIIIRWRGVLLVPVGVLYLYTAGFYLGPAREIERLDKTTWDPVFSHLSESIEGGSVIRAFGDRQRNRFNSLNDSKLDVRNKIQYAKLAVSQWFALRIQLIGSLLVFVVAYSLVLLHDQLSAAIVGLAFSYVLKISQSLEVIVQSWSRVETMMVSPERLQEYIDGPQEAASRVPGMDPPSHPEWPSTGAIAFKQVNFRYKPSDPLVLKNLSFAVRGGEKIGIVGRTGAGKSSLTVALFRINELASGSILIDGVDVSKIGLKTLREQLSIIPQNPVLFEGTLRNCLDPFAEYSDEQLWESIRQVGLSDRISEAEHKLEYNVEENGENFSVGERQMLCMARALLRHSRIVIFDEATAAIDHETDKKLQQVIRTAFAPSTVLTIAHRLDTILDSDRILVLDHGEAVAYAKPQELVQRGKGHFFDLAQEGGYLSKFQQQ
ncbi:Multidrug resistance-associated protein 1 [Globisporangium polare]